MIDPLDELARRELMLVECGDGSDGEAIKGSGETRVASALDSAVLQLRARCRGVWPPGGRVHPSDANTMLGGALKLQMQRQVVVEDAISWLALRTESLRGIQVLSALKNPVCLGCCGDGSVGVPVTMRAARTHECM